MNRGTRGELLDRLAGAIESVPASHPRRVAVDGPPAAGKTTLADELALLLRARGREVIRASAEGFHRPRAQRYRRGEFSPEANYHDSFDYDALRRVLLDPLGPDGDRRYQHAVYDIDTDTAVSQPATTAAADAVLLLDGVFLLRPELIDRWDLRILVSAAFEQTLDRARVRDLARLGSTADVERRFRTRYIPAQKLYFAAARPADHADIIVHNDEPLASCLGSALARERGGAGPGRGYVRPGPQPPGRDPIGGKTQFVGVPAMISRRRGSPTDMAMNAFDEAALLENARLGDEHAFAELTGTYQGELRSYCYRMLAVP